MLTGALFLLLAILAFGRETPLGASLYRLLVERPAALLNRLTAGHVWGIVLLLTLASAMAHFAGSEGLRMAVMAVPDVGVWFALFDVGTLLDVLAVAVAVAGVTRLRTMRLVMVACFARLRSRRRRRRRTKPRAPAADDEDGPAYAFSIVSQIWLAPAKSSLWMAVPKASNSLGISLP